VEVQLHALSTSALSGGEWSASCPGKEPLLWMFGIVESNNRHWKVSLSGATHTSSSQNIFILFLFG